MREKIKNFSQIKRKINPLAISFLLPMIVAILLFAFDKIYYLMPDDYLMHQISKGEFGNGKDAYLIFINIILGYIIKGLNELMAWGDWFILLYIITIISCFSCLIFVFLKRTKNIFIISALLLTELIVFYNLTFTIVAYLCIATALTYWCYIIDGSHEMRTINILIVCVFFSLGIMYRKGVWLSAIILFLPFLVFHVKEVLRKNNFILGGILCLIFISTTFVNEQAYSNDKIWREYTEFNQVRAQVVDNTPIIYDENIEKLEEIGLSENDLKCVYRWIFADKEIFSTERLQALSELNPVKEKWNLDIPDIFRKMVNLKYNYYFLIIICLAFYFNKSKSYLYLVFVSFITYAQIAALYVRNRPVERIMIPIYFIGGILLFWYVNERKKKEWKYLFVSSICVIITILPWVNIVNKNQHKVQDYTYRNYKYETVYEYINSHSEILFAGSSTTLNEISYNDSVFEIGNQVSAENIIKLGSWDIYSSRYYHQVEKYRVRNEERLILGMINNDAVNYIVQKQNPEEVEILKQYMREHIGIEVRFLQLEELDEMVIYKIIADI